MLTPWILPVFATEDRAIRLPHPVGRSRYSRSSRGGGPVAGWKSPWSTSGSRSAPLGQRRVPATGSTEASAKRDSSRSSAKTPSPNTSAKSSSRTSPSVKVSRSWVPPRCSTSTTRGGRATTSGYRSGSIATSASRACALRQFATSSSRWRSSHSRTRRRATRGRSPRTNEASSIRTSASWSP